jgi:hypothetical protein
MPITKLVESKRPSKVKLDMPAQSVSTAPKATTRAKSKSTPEAKPRSKATDSSSATEMVDATAIRFSSRYPEKGGFTLFHSIANDNEDQPPVDQLKEAVPGDIFWNHNPLNLEAAGGKVIVWYLNKEREWVNITQVWLNNEELEHPTISGRFLTKSGSHPNWVLLATIATKKTKAAAHAEKGKSPAK